MYICAFPRRRYACVRLKYGISKLLEKIPSLLTVDKSPLAPIRTLHDRWILCLHPGWEFKWYFAIVCELIGYRLHAHVSRRHCCEIGSADVRRNCVDTRQILTQQIDIRLWWWNVTTSQRWYADHQQYAAARKSVFIKKFFFWSDKTFFFLFSQLSLSHSFDRVCWWCYVRQRSACWRLLYDFFAHPSNTQFHIKYFYMWF